MAKFAVMTFMFEPWCSGGPTRHERMIEGLAGLGVAAVEPFHTLFVQEPALVARYKRALGENGMRVSAVDIICDLAYSSAEEMRKGRETLRRGLELSAELGAEVAHVAGHTPKEGISLPEARKRIAGELSREAEFAARHGLTLAIEDFGLAPTLLCKGADCLETLKYANGAVRFVFDIGNFEFAGEHANENFQMLYDHTCYVHVKDWRPAKHRAPGDTDFGLALVGCPLGQGIVPAARTLAQLKSKGYAGWLSLEVTSLLDDPMMTVGRDLAVLKRWIEEAQRS